jgi:TolB-like protein/class 3 adenylate cyclase
VDAGGAISTPVIRTLLLCDLVASTELVERLGDARAAELLARHDRAARDLLANFDGHEIDKSDGFLLLFERPIEAVRFAVAYQAKLDELGAAYGSPVVARVGIHVGEVVLRHNAPEDVARGAKPLEVEGLAKAAAARVMSLAGDGRILLTRSAYDLARRAAVGIDACAGFRWAEHGRYRLAGIEGPVEVCQVAGPGDAKLTAPESTTKARREKETDASGGACAEPLLAVLAFENLSADPEMGFFSDGVSEDIIQRLTRGARLKVIAPATSFQFRGERKAEAAGVLRCTHVLDGSIRRAGSRVRVSAHLTEAKTNTMLWSDRYDRSLEDIFAVQDDITESIAKALDQAFLRFSQRRVDPAVYDLYLQASPKTYSPDEFRPLIALLEVATERAPDFAEAWGRLVYLRSWLHFYIPFAERPANAERMAHDAARALALDPEGSSARMAQALALPAFGRFIEFDALIERIRASAGSSDTRRYLGWGLRAMGRVRESLVETERCYQLDPLSLMSANMVGLARMAAGRVDEAVHVFAHVLERAPEMTFPFSSLLRAYAFQQDWDAVDRMLALAEKREMHEFREGLSFIRAKRDPSPQRIATWWREVEDFVGKTGSIDVGRLAYSAHLGLVDEAYQVAETAVLGPTGTPYDIMGPDGYRPTLMFQARMPELRNDPRFPRLCARLGLVELWLATGKWPDCADEVPYDFRAACAEVRDIPKEKFGFGA